MTNGDLFNVSRPHSSPAPLSVPHFSWIRFGVDESVTFHCNLSGVGVNNPDRFSPEALRPFDHALLAPTAEPKPLLFPPPAPYGSAALFAELEIEPDTPLIEPSAVAVLTR